MCVCCICVCLFYQCNAVQRGGAVLTRDGESARPPTEAFSSSIVGGMHLALSDTRGLILILNFFLLSSSSSESLEEKKCFPLEESKLMSRTTWSEQRKHVTRERTRESMFCCVVSRSVLQKHRCLSEACGTRRYTIYLSLCLSIHPSIHLSSIYPSIMLIRSIIHPLTDK